MTDTKTDKQRDVRLDLLRALAIIGVVTLHIVGALKNNSLNSGNRLLLDTILAFVNCSVNLFGLLSGYLKIDKKQHHSSIIKILAETFFWCLIIAIVSAIFFGQNSPSLFVLNVFPILTNRLWYITAYFFVFMLAPYFNILAERLSQSSYKKLLLLLTLLMCLIPTVFMIDPYVSHGYSAGWLAFMYLLGGYFKKYGFNFGFKKSTMLFVLLISVCIMVASLYGLQKFVVPKFSGSGINFDGTILFDYYNSPLVLLNSIIVMYLCVSIAEIKNIVVSKVLVWISNVSLGVYIIHAHPFVLDNILTGKTFGWAVFSNPILTVAVSLGVVLVVLFATGLLEQLRMILFKVCGLDNCIKKAGAKLDRKLFVEKN